MQHNSKKHEQHLSKSSSITTIKESGGAPRVHAIIIFLFARKNQRRCTSFIDEEQFKALDPLIIVWPRLRPKKKWLLLAGAIDLKLVPQLADNGDGNDGRDRNQSLLELLEATLL